VRPALPSWLSRVRPRGRRVGGAHLDLAFTRAEPLGERVQVTIERQSGEVEVWRDGTLAAA